MTHELPLLSDRMRIIVPGTWASIPLDDPAETKAFVKQLVRKQVGRADRFAQLRRETAQSLESTAQDAVELGVHTYLMSFELLPGIPFPAAMLARNAKWPENVVVPEPGADATEALRLGYPGFEIAARRVGPMARLAEFTPEKIGDEEINTLRLEYVTPYPGNAQLLVVRVNVPNLPGAEPFATLFDEIVDSLQWGEEAITTDSGSK